MHENSRERKKTHIFNKSFPYTFNAKGKSSWPFNKWEWRLLKLPSELDQAKKKLVMSTNLKEPEEAEK